ncbi:hypothetical protein C0992_003376 [Termitomyces sp. T32_za158]|nr:hypothetical protein C0992_003376 [Termitomyces sp. T32_za158]
MPPAPFSVQCKPASKEGTGLGGPSPNPAKRHYTHNKREVSPEDETIDKRDSRPTRTLPGRKTVPMVWPNPFDMTDLPKDSDDNPNLQLTQRGPEPPVLPTINSTPFTQATYPQLAIPFERLIANLDPVLVEKVSSKTSQYLAVLPFGAGASLFAASPSINVEILNFLVTLGIQENLTALALAKARWRSKPKGKSDFQTPWTLILSGFSKDLGKYLVWQQTFAVSTMLTFSVVPFDKDLCSWMIMNISGDAVKPGSEAETHALGTIKSTLWQNTRFRTAANAAMSASNVPGSTNERTLKVTESFCLAYIESHNAQGEFAPIWQLTGRPVTNNPDLHKAVIEAIQAPHYWLSTHLMEIGKRFVKCSWCKADTHPAHACPLPKTPDWAGPKPDNAERFKKRHEHPQSNSNFRGRRGRGRGRGMAKGFHIEA